MKLGLWMLIKGVELKPEGIDTKALTAAEAAAILAWEIKAVKAAGELCLAMQEDERMHLSIKNHCNGRIDQSQITQATRTRVRKLEYCQNIS